MAKRSSWPSPATSPGPSAGPTPWLATSSTSSPPSTAVLPREALGLQPRRSRRLLRRPPLLPGRANPKLPRPPDLPLLLPRPIWSDSASAAAFLTSVDTLLSIIRDLEPPLLDRADDLLQQSMLRLEDEFRSILDSSDPIQTSDPHSSEGEETDDDDPVPVANPISSYDIIIDAIPPGSVSDLRSIAERVIAPASAGRSPRPIPLPAGTSSTRASPASGSVGEPPRRTSTRRRGTFWRTRSSGGSVRRTSPSACCSPASAASATGFSPALSRTSRSSSASASRRCSCSSSPSGVGRREIPGTALSGHRHVRDHPRPVAGHRPAICRSVLLRLQVARLGDPGDLYGAGEFDQEGPGEDSGARRRVAPDNSLRHELSPRRLRVPENSRGGDGGGRRGDDPSVG
ncbi:uncharacterized protein M6B38_304010 [Iris pallida]|uniref:Uncharacterized protein n=1 Tax=Iris pallida TaxID=29817 RepID=A0AAX6HMX8_IRIPA|nr:uncharacterized protein M6B38_304010 [Iris pallida]